MQSLVFQLRHVHQHVESLKEHRRRLITNGYGRILVPVIVIAPSEVTVQDSLSNTVGLQQRCRQAGNNEATLLHERKDVPLGEVCVDDLDTRAVDAQVVFLLCIAHFRHQPIVRPPFTTEDDGGLELACA